MNIHIDKEKFDYIMNNTKIFGEFVVGSKLYGLDNENSDTDYLIIYNPFKNELTSPFTNHHQYQYKDVENNIDYNLVNVVDFVRNLVSGDSTINYELLHSKDFQENESLGWLSKYIDKFSTYNICKSYLGMAKRDITHLNKRKTISDKLSGFMHAVRGLISAQYIMGGCYTLNIMRDETLESFRFYQMLTTIDPNKVILEDIKNQREKLNTALENKEIIRFLGVDTQIKITYKLNSMCLVDNDKFLDIADQYYYNNDVELKY